MSNTSTIIYVLQHTFDMEPKNKCSLNKRYIINIIANQMATYFSISVGGCHPASEVSPSKSDKLGPSQHPAW